MLVDLPLPQATLEIDGCHCWRVSPMQILRVLALLRDHHDYNFKQLTDITAIDYFPVRSDDQGRFDVVYHLLSHRYNRRGRVVTTIQDGDEAISIVDLFENANWYEREIWDLFGIPFRDHPDLRRILTDYGFEGHPLRKDFPLSGHTQVRFDEGEQRVVREKVHLEQPYRDFDHTNPWHGREPLPGDEKATIVDAAKLVPSQSKVLPLI